MIEEFESTKYSVRANLLDKHKYNHIVSEKVTITDKDSYYYLNSDDSYSMTTVVQPCLSSISPYWMPRSVSKSFLEMGPGFSPNE